MRTLVQHRFRGSLLDDRKRAHATFERDSVAFLDGQEYAPDVPRFRREAVCGVSDGELKTAYFPMCVLDGVLVGTRADYEGIWESADGGDSWTQNAAGLQVFRMWALHSGAMLFTSNLDGRVRVYRSAPGERGRDIDPEAMPEPSLTYRISETGYTVPDFFNFGQAPHGTVVMGEYNGPPYDPTGTHLYRSTDDGVSFETVYIEQDPIRHGHAIAYHRGAERWVAVYGDSPEQNKIVYSDDDGETWADLPQHGQPGLNEQPVSFLDYGDPTKLLSGSDSVCSVYTLDVVSGDIEQAYPDNDRENQPHAWGLAKHAGVYYAMTAGAVQNARHVLVVSEDLRHWATYHRFVAGEYNAAHFVGYSARKLHWLTVDNAGGAVHFRVSPTAVGAREAVLVEPAAINLLGLNASTAPQLWDWIPDEATVTESDAYALHGASSGKLAANEGAAQCTLAAYIAAVPGRNYRGKVSLYSPHCKAWGLIYAYSVPSWTYLTPDHYFSLGPYWGEVEGPVWTCQAGDELIKVVLRFFTEVGGELEVYVDCAQVEETTPTTWQVGGTPRAVEALSHGAVGMPAAWTNLLRVSPLTRAEYLGSGTRYVKTWKLDAQNYLSLFFDEGKFKLLPTVAGVAGEALESSVQWWQRNGGMALGMALDATGTRLLVGNGGPVEVVAGAALPGFLGAELSALHGDADGGNVLPHSVADDRVVGRTGSDGELGRWLNAGVLRRGRR